MSDRPTSFVSAVVIPSMQALICGVLFALAGVAVYHAWGVRTGWALFWAGLSGVAFIAWLMVLKRWLSWSDALAGIMPAPVQAVTYPTETRLHLAIDWDQGRGGLFEELDIDDATFIAWACDVARGKSLGENWHTGRHGRFSKGTYHQFLGRLEFQGVIRKRGRAINSGFELTGKGRAITDEVLSRYGSPSPASMAYLKSGAIVE